MNETNPYTILGIDADAPFEDIQAAKARILTELDENDRQRQVVEAAYDAILMQRLQLRKEGKVKVPDRIRFPEAMTPQPVRVAAKPPAWWEDWIERPVPSMLWVPVGVFGGLGALSLLPGLNHSYVLSLAVMACAYFLFQKNRNLLRSLGLSLGVLVVSGILTYFVTTGLSFPLLAVGLILFAYLAATAYLK
ncbi:CPP1-like family protein [Anthocerotibacter panamensis]|uniref:CPP1-like family protein n=1 Tax=Anthocerotibacter panamensis TaxID=2857077 RepID=UPI001C4038B7|nr:CPP1-like family protein [Anthocerotibacter panamensis]